ncbi:unnamed protein product, partial [Brassica rapa subsp. trilocularis]
AASQISVSELRRGRCARIVVTRLLLFWEARNAKKGGELIGHDVQTFPSPLSFNRQSSRSCILTLSNPRSPQVHSLILSFR